MAQGKESRLTMQIITITGYLSRDAESSTTQKGDQVTRWNVPVKQGWGESEQTNWFSVSIWGKRADFAAKSRKGDFVTVTGELSIGEYQGKPQYEIRASDFQAVRTAPRDDNGRQDDQRGGGGSNSAGRQSQGGYQDDLDDNIPFARNDGIW